jgi:DNA polymerase III epsilon subunit-like protein
MRTQKIDRRKSYFITFDTETANSLECPLMYDLGFAVHDKQGNIYETFSLVIADVYCNEKEIMQSAYYSRKLPQYEEDLKTGKKKLVSVETAKRILSETAKKYNIKAVIAHNARFDYRSTTTTIRYITKSKNRYFLPYEVPLWDTLEMAKSVIKDKPTYRDFCERNGYLTKNGQVRLTAEILYRFISKDENFIEQHQGLEDVLIEKEIFQYCVRQHKKMRRSPWKKED